MWMDKCHQLIDGTDFETTNRSRVAVSLLHLSMEHQKAICVLVGCENANGSAFALLRPQFEAFVRGLWFNRCASDTELEYFISEKQPPKIDKLIAAIEKTPGYTNGSLMRKKASLWNVLNDYTHGGTVQVKARNNGTEIIGSYREDHLVWLLKESAGLALLAGLEIANVAGNEGLLNDLLSNYNNIYRSVPQQVI